MIQFIAAEDFKRQRSSPRNHDGYRNTSEEKGKADSSVSTMKEFELLTSGRKFSLEKASELLNRVKKEESTLPAGPMRCLISEAICQNSAGHVEDFCRLFHKYSSPGTLVNADYVQVLSFYILKGQEGRLLALFEKLAARNVVLSAAEWELCWWAGEPMVKTSKVVQILVEAMERQYSPEDASSKITMMMDKATLDLALSETLSYNLVSHALVLFEIVKKWRLESKQGIFFSTTLVDEFLRCLIAMDLTKAAYSFVEFLGAVDLSFNEGLLSLLFESVCRSGPDDLADDVCYNCNAGLSAYAKAISHRSRRC